MRGPKGENKTNKARGKRKKKKASAMRKETTCSVDVQNTCARQWPGPLDRLSRPRHVLECHDE